MPGGFSVRSCGCNAPDFRRCFRALCQIDLPADLNTALSSVPPSGGTRRAGLAAPGGGHARVCQRGAGAGGGGSSAALVRAWAGAGGAAAVLPLKGAGLGEAAAAPTAAPGQAAPCPAPRSQAPNPFACFAACAPPAARSTSRSPQTPMQRPAVRCSRSPTQVGAGRGGAGHRLAHA